jgi:hypothetical protein
MDLGFHADEMPPLTLIAWLRIGAAFHDKIGVQH